MTFVVSSMNYTCLVNEKNSTLKRILMTAALMGLMITASAAQSDKGSITFTADGSVGTIRIVGRINAWYNSAEDVEHKINDLVAQGVNEITLYIRSWGGDVMQANEIANAILKSKLKVTVEIGAWAGSAATAISSHFSTVKMAKNGWFMIHKPAMEFEGNEDEVERKLTILKTLTTQYADLYAKKTGKSADYIKSQWVNDWWMTADQAKENGFVDEILGEESITPEDVSEMQAAGLIKPIAANAVGKQPTPPKKNETHLKMNEKQLMATALSLGLEAEASAEEVMAEMKKVQAKAAKYDALEAEKANEAKTTKATKVKALLDDKVKANEIDAAQHTSLTAMSESEGVTFEMIENLVSGMTAAPDLSKGLDPSGGEQTGEFKAWGDFTAASAEAQVAFAKAHPDKLKKLYADCYDGDVLTDASIEKIVLTSEGSGLS